MPPIGVCLQSVTGIAPASIPAGIPLLIPRATSELPPPVPSAAQNPSPAGLPALSAPQSTDDNIAFYMENTKMGSHLLKRYFHLAAYNQALPFPPPSRQTSLSGL